jgi:hypothetical protein
VLRVLARTAVPTDRNAILSVDACTTSKSGDSLPFMTM